MATVEIDWKVGDFWDAVIQATPLGGELYTVSKFEEVKHEALVSKETAEININYLYFMYLYFLDLVTPDFDEPTYWLASTKLYPYFLYSFFPALPHFKKCE